jgi:RNA-directed DNA polymerase
MIPTHHGKDGQYEVTVPVILDRCHQARAKNALEPEWEARFAARVYGFRPGRSCQDAAVALHKTLSGNAKRTWILDADLKAAFDKIDHAFLLGQLGTFPARDMIAGWLKAGVFEAGRGFAPTEEGVPQGGIISPLLLGVALHGLEDAAGVRHLTSPSREGHTRPDSPVAVVYADDFVICCHSRQQAEGIRAKLAGWLAGRGLALNEDKTRIVRLTEGFDFLGWNFRRYPAGKTLVKPSRASVKRHRERLSGEMRRLRGSNAGVVISTLNPVIRGWCAYHRSQVSSEAFARLGHYTWQLTWKWATWSHPGKGKRWIAGKYYGTFCPSRDDKWVLGNRDTSAYLLKHPWTPIRRHILVKGRSSPDDPDLAGYWENRRRRNGLALDPGTLSLLARQEHQCPHCRDPLLDVRHLPASPEEWQEWWHGVTRQDIPRAASVPGPPGHPEKSETVLALVHVSCHQSHRLKERRIAA